MRGVVDAGARRRRVDDAVGGQTELFGRAHDRPAVAVADVGGGRAGCEMRDLGVEFATEQLQAVRHCCGKARTRRRAEVGREVAVEVEEHRAAGACREFGCGRAVVADHGVEVRAGPGHVNRRVRSTGPQRPDHLDDSSARSVDEGDEGPLDESVVAAGCLVGDRVGAGLEESAQGPSSSAVPAAGRHLVEKCVADVDFVGLGADRERDTR